MASSAHAGAVIPARGIRLDALVIRHSAVRASRYALMLVLALFFLLPYAWMVSGSLRTQNEIFANLQPFLAAIFSLLILSESIGRLQIAGGIAIAGAIVLSRDRRAPVAAGADGVRAAGTVRK